MAATVSRSSFTEKFTTIFKGKVKDENIANVFDVGEYKFKQVKDSDISSVKQKIAGSITSFMTAAITKSNELTQLKMNTTTEINHYVDKYADFLSDYIMFRTSILAYLYILSKEKSDGSQSGQEESNDGIRTTEADEIINGLISTDSKIKENAKKQLTKALKDRDDYKSKRDKLQKLIQEIVPILAKIEKPPVTIM